MNPFALFAAQHAALLEQRNRPSVKAAAGRRPYTDTEKALLAFIRDNADCTAVQMAAAVGIEPDLVYPIVQRFRRNGEIESTGKVGNGYSWRARA